MRIVIAGGPGTGKSTLAKELAEKHRLNIRATDDLIGLPWSQQSEVVAGWLHGSVRANEVIEGVRATLGLRKALQRSPRTLQVDKVIFMHAPHRERAPGAVELARRINAEWLELRRELLQRGVEVEDLPRGATGLR